MPSKKTAFAQTCLLTLLAPAALAQEESPLAGPRVVEADGERPTLVKRDFDGHVRALETTAPEAALALLTLSDEERARADALLARRAKLLEDFVSENIFLLGRIDTADKAGNKAGAALMLLEAADKLRPVTRDGPFERQLAATLDDANAQKLLSLVREHDRAAISDRCSMPNKEGKMPSRFEAAAGLRAESFFREIERAYKRLEESGEVVFRLIFAGVELNAEQSTKVRELLEMHQRSTKGNATDKDNATLFFAIVPHLTQEQAKQVVANVKALESGRAPGAQKKPAMKE